MKSHQFTAKYIQIKRITLVFFATLILSSVLQPFVASKLVSAADPPPATRTLVKRYEALRALLSGKDQDRGQTFNNFCTIGDNNEISSTPTTNLGLKPELDSAGYNQISEDILDDDITINRIRVPATLFGDGFGTLTCKKALELYIEGKYGKYDKDNRIKFIKEYYDTSTSFPIKLKTTGKSDAWSDIHAYMLSLIEGRTQSFLWWRDRIISQAFNTCFKWNNPTPIEDATEDELFTKSNWTEEEGGNKSVGYMAELAIQESYVDGVVNCEDVMTFIFDDPGNRYILSYSQSDLQDDLDAAEALRKRQEIREEFATDPSAFLYCVAGTPGTELFQQLPESTQYDLMAGYIVDGDDTVGIGDFLSAEAAKAVADCLRTSDQFGETIEDITSRPPPSADREESDNGEDQGDTCYDSIEPLITLPGGIKIPNPLKWAICGLSQILAGLIDSASDAVQDLLQFNPTSSEDGGDQLKIVWSSILRIANILFVIGFLVMIISTALDLGIFSNYTVKKLLPKIIIGVILANLSWEICRVLIEMTNAIGGITREVILSPLEGTIACDPSDTGGCLKAEVGRIVGQNGTAITVGIGALVYASIASAGAILLPIMATIAIAVVLAVLVLLLRRIIIILLIVAAPFAFAALALPGGEQWMKRWWKMFTQMLLMYPMIMALFASGIFISTVLKFSVNDDLVSQGMNLLALFLPFFMLPVLFKAAGGAISSFTGMVNDRSKGLVDRSKNWRDQGSQYGRRKEMKKQRKNFSGNEKMLEGLHGEGYLSSRRRGQALGRAWLNKGAQTGQRTFLAKTRASASKERLEAASYDLEAGGIDTKGELFDAEYIDKDGEKKNYTVRKDDALALATLGAIVKRKRDGRVVSDGSEDSQRAAAMYATRQGLAPVMNKARGTAGKDQNIKNLTQDASGNWLETKQEIHGLEQLQGGSERQIQANTVISEAMQTNVGSMMPKMTSYYKGPKQAFGRIEAGALAQFDPTEAVRNVEWLTETDAQGNYKNTKDFLDEKGKYSPALHREAIDRLGASVAQIVAEPAKYNASPEMLKELRQSIANSGLVLDPRHTPALGKINKDGTIL